MPGQPKEQRALHYASAGSVLKMGCKAVGSVCQSASVKDPRALFEEVKWCRRPGAPVRLQVAHRKYSSCGMFTVYG